MSDVTYCVKCGTPNEPDYKFCKNCGAPIVKIKKKVVNPNVTVDDVNVQPSSPEILPPISNSVQGPDPREFIIDGVSAEEFTLFIGKKTSDIFPKFTSMYFSNSKVSWCWPAAVLAFFFGPMGLAIWYFYRKMYKPGAIMMSIALFMYLLNSIASGLYTINLSVVMTDILSGVPFSISSLLPVGTFKQIFILSVSLLDFIVDLLALILGGIFSYNLYKNHCVQKITEYKSKQHGSVYYKLGISSLGGTSGGMATLAVIVMFMAASLSTVITEIVQVLFF